MNIDLTPAQRELILELIERHLPNTTVWVYGSRTKGTARRYSDLNMVVFSTPEQWRDVSDLEDAFEESDLPFRVDLFTWDRTPDSFKANIEAEHIALVERGEDASAGK